MATIKSFTSVEQSKKLAKILPLESADMYYDDIVDRVTGELFIPDDGSTIKVGKRLGGTIAAWSLVALLDVLPQSITKYIDDERCQKTFHLNLFRSYHHYCSYSYEPSVDDDGIDTLYCIDRDNWVDACVAMIERLHELKML